ncbi:AraC family transcriptional regulator [Agaribacter marinus]|nr:helix-turn-helix domain-containing protein [Agaribacter marinus]
MEQILSHSQAANVMICLVLALHLFSVSTRVRLPARMLGVNYLMYSCQSFLLIGLLNDVNLSYTSVIRPTTAMLLGPVFYFYFLTVKRTIPQFKWVDYLHFFPCLLVLFAFIAQSRFLYLTDYLIIGSFAFYLILMTIPMLQGVKVFSHLSTEPKRPYQWLCILALMMAVNIVAEVAVLTEIHAGKALNESLALFIGTSLFLVINAIVAFATLRRNPLIEWMYELSVQTFSENDVASAENNAHFGRWEVLVTTEELYKKEFGITLSEAARKLQIPARQLSNAINQCYGRSFSQYLNDKRVKEAQRLIQADPEMTMIDVMYAAGFNSKSNFNKEFQRVSGMPPSKYRLALLVD